MKAVEFCYWLQGAFELAQIPLTAEQIACVQKHLALVEATPQTGQPKQATDFCSWLRGGLDFITPGDTRQVQAIRTKLNDCFEHAIDGMYPNQNKLNEIHGGSPRPPPDDDAERQPDHALLTRRRRHSLAISTHTQGHHIVN